MLNENQMLITSLITSICTVVTLLLAYISFRADHRRRKRQATIEFYHEISLNVSIPLRQLIMTKYNRFSHTPIPPEEISLEDEENIDFRLAFIRYCRSMERFAVGIEAGVYDYYIFSCFSAEDIANVIEKHHKERPKKNRIDAF